MLCNTGELLSAACEQGVAHPPGYPLWTMLSSLAIRLSPVTPAYAVNLLTGVIAALSSAVLFVACHWYVCVLIDPFLWV